MTASPDTTTLVGWLREQLSRDERTAQAAQPGPWWVGEFGPIREADARHIALHDPQAVLADVEAKRKLLDRHSSYDFPYVGEDGGDSDYSWQPCCDECNYDWPCPTLRLLASVYRHRPGWQESWQP